MASLLSKPIAIVAGAGPGTGASIARRFAKAYPVVLLARSQSSLDPLVDGIDRAGGSAIGIPSDVTNAGDLASTMKQIEQQFGSDLTVAAAVFNVASKFTRAPFLESKHRVSGYIGATAALKGGSGLGSFAMSKFAVRALSQSLAREFGPQDVHVAHAIIDGIIATEKTKEYKKDVPDSKVDPDWIAESYWFLHTQSRSAFTHELDLRPYCETW
ncbi:putative oxidoreductase,short chain dehydrogenase [Aspergillus ellipticus CBS 707.79]|uniref:Putative oxidoreductase,short chain dehydrogenase n=1 Tax=Aspergillus ellipticus CBS 707.79 TaxID=1448320 RepID=A0A319DB51_9EURO|nr:putative oxidoreductase,short chain dehydrogenase [Aspergillus ellipticus CBS 707.79]